MDIPEWLMETFYPVLDDHPEVTHILVQGDLLGGYKMDYVKSKARAELLAGGLNPQKFEIVVVEE
jgi:hypothetical protein